MSAVFDTLKHAKRLKEAGFTESQAEGQAEALADVLRQSGQGLVTKADLKVEIAEIKGALTLVQWMLGFNLALSVAMLLAAVGPYVARLFGR